MEQEFDQELWRLARKRVKFRKHLAVYVVMNVFFWVLWYFTDRRYDMADRHTAVPWPLFAGLGWGLGLVFHYLGAFVFHAHHKDIAREYEKLKKDK